jgi:hypothetical protein
VVPKFRRPVLTGSVENRAFPRVSSSNSAEFRVHDGSMIRNNGQVRIVGIAGDSKVRRHRPTPTNAKIKAAIVGRSAGK